MRKIGQFVWFMHNKIEIVGIINGIVHNAGPGWEACYSILDCENKKHIVYENEILTLSK